MAQKYASTKLKDPSVCRIFFSSPFNGMEGEREDLTRRYWPQIQSLCRAKGIEFVPVDMRWGITMEQSANAQTINICLREIERSDMFVGFFGQRYGWQGRNDDALQENFDAAVSRFPWIENFRDRSVTELEFLHGHLRHPGEIPTIICFRDKAFDDIHRQKGVEEGNKRMIYKFSSESDLATTLMDNLKAKVMSTKEHCLFVHMAYPDPEQGAKLMFDKILEHLNTVLLKDTEEKPSQRQEMIRNNNAFCNTRTSLYVGGENYKSSLNQFISNASGSSPLLVLGEPGIGKSALLANWIRELEKQQQDITLIYHFIRPGTILKDVRALVAFIHLQLVVSLRAKEGSAAMTKAEEDVEFQRLMDMESYQRAQALRESLETACKQGLRPLIVVDGLEKIDYEQKTAKPMFWVPSELPSAVSLILSTQSTDTAAVEELVQNRGYKQLDIQPLLLAEQQQISQESLMVRGKTLSTEQMQRVVEAEQTQNPLFLKIVLEELCSFGKFRELDKKIDSLVYCESATELFGQFLERLEADYNSAEYEGNLVEHVMTAIYVSRHGLVESELCLMFTIPSHVWSPLYFVMENYLVDRAGQIGFAHSELNDAVYKRFIQTQEKLNLLRNQQADIFLKWTEGDVSTTLVEHYVNNLSWLYHQSGNREALRQTLLSLNFFQLMAKNRDSLYDLLEYVQAVGLSGEQLAEELMARINMNMAEVYHIEQEHLLIPNPGLEAVQSLEVVQEFLDFAHYRNASMTVLLKMKHILDSNSYHGGDKDRREKQLNNIYFLLAVLYVDLKMEDKALPLFLQLIDFCKSHRGAENLNNLARMCHGAGTAFFGMDKLEQSLEMIDLSIATHKLIPELDPGSYQVNKSRNMRVKVLTKQDNFEEARDECLQVLQKEEEKYFGSLPPEISHVLVDLAVIYRRLNQFDKAEEVLQQSLKIKLNAFGEHHFDMALAYINLSNLHSDQSDFVKACEFCKKAVDTFEVIGEGESIDAYRTRESYISLTFVQDAGKEPEIEDMYWKLLDFYMKENILDTGLIYVHKTMAEYYALKVGDNAKCEQICLALIGSKIVSPAHFLLLNTIDRQKPEEQREERDEKYSIHAGYQIFPDHQEIQRVRMGMLIPERNLEDLDQMLQDYYGNSDNDQTENMIIGCVNLMKEIGWHEGVIELCERWRKRRDDFVDIIWQLCMAYNNCSQLDKATECGYLVYQMNKENIGVAMNVAVMSIMAEQWSIATQMITDLMEIYKDNADVQAKVEQFKELMEQKGHPYASP